MRLRDVMVIGVLLLPGLGVLDGPCYAAGPQRPNVVLIIADDLGVPIGRRLEILCDTARRVWRPAPDAGLPTGAEKARWLADHILSTWDALDRPCPHVGRTNVRTG